MTKVDFYVLQSDTEEQRLNFACRLLEKAARQGNKILVTTPNEKSSETLDKLLWEFKAESYLPHHVLKHAEDHTDQAIAISHTYDSEQHHDVLVNLAEALPESFSRFKRYAQIVNQAEPYLEASRQHFAFLKKRGYPIEINKLSY